MERSGSQKALLVISIISIVFGGITIIIGLLSAVGAIGVASVSSSDLAAAGVDTATAGVTSAGLGILSAVFVILGGLSVLEGILGIRAANDNQKIMPVWVLALISLALTAIGIVVSIIQGSFSASSILELALSGLMFWIANNIKQEAGR